MLYPFFPWGALGFFSGLTIGSLLRRREINVYYPYYPYPYWYRYYGYR